MKQSDNDNTMRRLLMLIQEARSKVHGIMINRACTTTRRCRMERLSLMGHLKTHNVISQSRREGRAIKLMLEFYHVFDG